MTETLGVTIREIAEGDLHQLHEWYPERDETFRRNIARHRSGEIVYLVAELDGQIVGHLGVDLVRKPRIALLWQFAVLSALQSRGIGSRMVEVAEALARDKGFTIAEIGAETTNPRARALYERLGYSFVFEQDGEWILRKDLYPE